MEESCFPSHCFEESCLHCAPTQSVDRQNPGPRNGTTAATVLITESDKERPVEAPGQANGAIEHLASTEGNPRTAESGQAASNPELDSEADTSPDGDAAAGTATESGPDEDPGSEDNQEAKPFIFLLSLLAHWFSTADSYVL